MHKKHRVKTHHWNNGVLETIEHVFSRFEEAIMFITKNRHRNAKIYDADDVLVHAVSNGSVETYA